MHVQPALRTVCLLARTLCLVCGGPALALTHETQQVDTANAYKNVAVVMFLYRGSAAEPESCTATLIHERVLVTAAHCTVFFTPAPPPWIRTVASFSHDNPRDPATWIDITAHLVHPAFPYRSCALQEPYVFGVCQTSSGGIAEFGDYAPGLVDAGLVVLARPVRDIVPAPLADIGALARAAPAPMVFVGYGCSTPAYPHWDGWRNYGTATVTYLIENTVAFEVGPGTACIGDSGGPTFLDGRVAAVYSSGDRSYSYRTRTDTPLVQSWIASVLNDLDSTLAVEFYHAAFGHYFVTANADEIAKLDAGVFAGWARTGESFKVYTATRAGFAGVCRFFTTAFGATS